MDSEAIIKWAKSNKKRIVKEYFTRNDYLSSENPNIIFMAGVPGAGKTEFAKRLLPQLTTLPLHIDMDEIAQQIESFKPRIAHLYRAGASIILERLYDVAINKKIDILMDGTFSHPKVISNIERALKHNYSVRIYFISPDPLTAWQKTLEREVVEKRSINSDGFVDSYFGVLSNLNQVATKYGKKVPITIVIKDKDNRLKDIVESIVTIESYLKPSLTKDELKDKIKL